MGWVTQFQSQAKPIFPKDEQRAMFMKTLPYINCLYWNSLSNIIIVTAGNKFYGYLHVNETSLNSPWAKTKGFQTNRIFTGVSMDTMFSNSVCILPASYLSSPHIVCWLLMKLLMGSIRRSALNGDFIISTSALNGVLMLLGEDEYACREPHNSAMSLFWLSGVFWWPCAVYCYI